jgi:hypothetical protein
LFLFDEDKTPVRLIQSDVPNRFRPYDEIFSEYSFVLNRYAFSIFKNEKKIQIFQIKPKIVRVLSDQATEKIDHNDTKIEYHFVPFQEIPTWGFRGMESFGSSRGYIWSRTIPMIKDTLIWGHGPDTYPIYFPQHDTEGKIEFLASPERLVDKPHNLYLQFATNTGALSLIAFLAMIFIHIIQSGQLYRKILARPLEGENREIINPKSKNLSIDFNHPFFGLSVGLLTGIIGYLGAGIFNDSIVSVAPVFWVLFGTGLSVNEMIKKKFQSKKFEADT